MAYGKIKADTLVYDNSGSDVETTVASLAAKAGLASPAFTGTATAVNLTLSGNLTVNGTTTTIDSTTLSVEDKNIELGKVGTPTDTTADGGGITLKGATDKTFNWVDANDAWTSSEHIHLGDNKKVLLGTGKDLEIYFDGTHSKIVQTAGTNCYLASDSIILSNAAINEYYATAVANGAVTLYHDNSAKLATTAAGVTVTGAVSDEDGDVRNIPLAAKTSAYVLVAADAGRAIHITTGGVTVNNSVFSAGNAVTIINDSGSDQTITQGSGLTIYNSADAATGNRTLAGRGMATIWFAGADKAYISGAGLS